MTDSNTFVLSVVSYTLSFIVTNFKWALLFVTNVAMILCHVTL